jgi:hypothetical protein
LSGVTEIHDGVAVEVEVAVLVLRLVDDMTLEIYFRLDVQVAMCFQICGIEVILYRKDCW